LCAESGVIIITFDHLRYFIAIANSKSFSIAADNLYISQSSLSKQIKSLENELKTQLFIRRGAKIELTASGKLFLEFAKNTTTEYHEFLVHLPSTNAQKAYTLRLGTLPLMHEYNFLDCISQFQAQHEYIQLVLSEDTQFELLKMLDHHQLDTVIALSDFMTTYNYEYIPINRDALCVVCSKNHRLAAAKSIPLKEIKHEQLAMIHEKSGIYELLLNMCIKEGFSPNIVFTSNYHGHLLDMLKENRSMIAVLPSKLTNQTGLISIPLENKIYTTISLIRRKEKNPYLDEFFEWWKNEMQA